MRPLYRRNIIGQVVNFCISTKTLISKKQKPELLEKHQAFASAYFYIYFNLFLPVKQRLVPADYIAEKSTPVHFAKPRPTIKFEFSIWYFPPIYFLSLERKPLLIFGILQIPPWVCPDNTRS